MILKQLLVGPMANYCYVAAPSAGGGCVVIDPGWDFQRLNAEIEACNLKPAAVFLTHGHFDHSKNISQFLRRHAAPVYIETHDAAELTGIEKSGLREFSGDSVFEEAGLKISVLHTPGHSPGSVCLIIDGCLFTGDTLFSGACGRVDLPGSSPADMRKSLIRLSKLDGALKVYPGHAYGQPESTIAHEARHNPYIKLAADSLDAFIEAMS